MTVPIQPITANGISNFGLVPSVPQQPLVPASGILQSLPPSYSLTPAADSVQISSTIKGYMCSAPDGTIWCGSITVNTLYHYSIDGALLDSHAMGATYNIRGYGMCCGGEGNLYVGCSNGSTDYGILKVTTDGSYSTTYYAVIANQDDEFPYYLCAGIDGSIWCSYMSNTLEHNGLAKLQDGVVTVYPISGVKDVAGIVASQDGKIWWMNYKNVAGQDFYGYVTLDGRINKFPFPTGTRGDTYEGNCLVIGSDNNLYISVAGLGTNGFTGNTYILCIDSLGTVIETYDTGLYSYGTDSAISAPDGWMYFSTRGDNKQLRVNPAGRIEFITLTSGYFATLNSVMAGDGSMWGIGPDGIWRWPFITSSSTRSSSSPITTIAGNLGGTMRWSMPEQGPAYKKVVITTEDFNDSGFSITFPEEFNYPPAAGVNGAALDLTTLCISSIDFVQDEGLGSGTTIIQGM